MPFKSNVNNSEPQHQTGGPMVRSIRLTQDNTSKQADRSAEQRSLGPEDISKLAEIMAELTHLDDLEAMHEANMASLQRLKEAYDALLRADQASWLAAPFRVPRPEDGPAES